VTEKYPTETCLNCCTVVQFKQCVVNMNHKHTAILWSRMILH